MGDKLVWPHNFKRGWEYIKDRYWAATHTLKQDKVQQGGGGRHSCCVCRTFIREGWWDGIWTENSQYLRVNTCSSPGTAGVFWGAERLHFKLILTVEYAHWVHLYFVGDFHLLLNSLEGCDFSWGLLFVAVLVNSLRKTSKIWEKVKEHEQQLAKEMVAAFGGRCRYLKRRQCKCFQHTISPPFLLEHIYCTMLY